MWDEYVIDVTLEVYDSDIFNTRVFCFCPYEADTGTVVTGMNLITDWPEQAKVVGVVHMDGQEAVEKWIEEHPEEYKSITARIDSES